MSDAIAICHQYLYYKCKRGRDHGHTIQLTEYNIGLLHATGERHIELHIYGIAPDCTCIMNMHKAKKKREAIR